MKRKISLLLVIVCMFGLMACGPKDDSPSEQDSPPPEPETYTFEARYIRTGYCGGGERRHWPSHVVINSKEELQAYYEENKNVFSFDYSSGHTTFLDACDRYDDAYFERQNLWCCLYLKKAVVLFVTKSPM